MPNRRLLAGLLAASFSLSVLPLVRADVPVVGPNGGPVAAPATKPAADAPKFLRFVDDGKHGGRLEAAIVTYRNAAGVTVRLVSAVHIGEKSYYEGLNRTFESDDAVLYEMVKPKGSGAPERGVRSGSGVSDFQRFLKDALDLSFQLDEVDYTRSNFVHADLDAETFQRMQAERGESFTTLFLKALMDQMNKPQDDTKLDTQQVGDDLITVLTHPDMERQVKLLLAKHMDDVESTAAGLTGPNGSVILTERNKAALKVLADTLASGKKKISVFYGAAHMPSMSESLGEMGFKPVSTEWRMAWDLAIRTDQPSAIEKLLRNGLKALDDDNNNDADNK